MAEFRIVLLDLDPLRLERRDDVVHDDGGRGHTDRGEAQRLVERREAPRRDLRTASVHSPSKAARSVMPAAAQAAICRLRNERGQASQGAPSSVSMSVVIAAVCGAYGRSVNVSGIGREADLPDWPHALDRRELIEHVHGLHGHGQPDAVG